MKKMIFALAFCLISLSAFSQTDATTLWGELKKQGQVSMDFSLKGTDKDGVVISDESGKGYLQGDAYRIECGNMLICCDGTTMWLYNSDTDELVIDYDEALPFMKATNVKKDQKGNINATYAADDITFKVKITNIANPASKWDKSFFIIDQATLGDDTIVTDLRD